MVTASASQITTVGASFSGPLPPPSLLAKYNEAVPNGAERVMAIAERQSTHREHLEKCVVEGNVQAQKLGSVFGFIVAMTAVVGGIYLISIGKSTAGLVAVSCHRQFGQFGRRFHIRKASTSQRALPEGPDSRCPSGSLGLVTTKV